MPNIDTNPTALEAFQAQIKAKSWPAALDVLVTHGLAVRPSQAPKLRDAVRADRSLLDPRLVGPDGGAKRELTAKVLEPDRDEHGGVTADWLTDPVRLEDSVPHFSSNWRAEYQINHHVAFGDLAAAVCALRDFGLSCRISDFDGALFRQVTQQFHPRSILRDGGTIAIAPNN